MEATEERPFLEASVGEFLPDWRIELYFKDDDVFRKAASRQVAFYIWTGALVIVLILAAGGFAAQVVSRQVRLNRLKNDFIATVSHELKTPLASMRVLVDTLLEGHYRNQQQATEYLEMVSHENERLSRLIDNFLTFSRMERNKQTFDMLRVSPVTIARKAAEAVRTKFEQHQCECDIKIGENLPDVLADEDAMVTALVNLLDNACKYSYDDKQIGLRVFAEERLVYFAVTDNGIGLSRRAAKKIFKRFYQADRSLSRPAGGCGLGLSIVKFVVDAHKGSISVESKPGKGSTFAIKLAALK
jgi:signal transduction histidine kinase